ncbi:MAG: N-acetylmuramoyl-L-alanine amidase, partial [Anaerolineae bacterium]|nr:N-acetylmuramoyl-L-alanine amidase [Anaerolineae bacterium]
PGSLKARPLDQIKYVVLNHTAVDPSVGVDRLAAAHQKRWGAILYQYFIAADGTILQTNPLDQSVDLTQPWPGQAANIAIAGDFTAQVPTAAQLAAAGHLSAWLLQELKLPVDAVKGASELIPTQSPGIQWLQGQNWKGLLLARIADAQKAAGPGAPIDSATVQALRAQVSQLQQALSLAQASIAALTVERDQLRTQLSQAPDVAKLNQQIQDLTKQLQAANADKATLAQQIQMLANDKSALSQQVQALTAEKTQLTQQIAVLNQTIADLRRQLSGGSSTVPVPTIKDVTDTLPKHATNRYSTRSLDKITHITIHHSAAPANIPVETIAAYHVNNNDWPGIGYHFCVGPDGTIYQVNRLETISYHAGVVNDYTIGICLEGDFRNGLIPTPKQIESAGHLSAWLSQKLKIPVTNIMGHKEYPKNPTECPGDDWAAGQTWKGLLHTRVQAVLAGNLTPPAKTIGHYVLFWQRADSWAKEDYAAAANYVARFRPTHGFTPEDARNAEYVTIVGGPAGVSPAIEQMLRDAGCKVERLAGKDFADTKRMLDDLAQRGQRFQTFNM